MAKYTPTPEPTPKPDYMYEEEELETLYSEFKACVEKNEDVKAYIIFQNGLVDTQPVLQGDDNDYYLYHNWETGEDQTYGSLMLDVNNNITGMDQNTIIYGHYIYLSRDLPRNLVFTPLADLMDEANYENNKYLALISEGIIRYYVIARVYACPIVDGGEGYQVTDDRYQYNLTSYDDEYFQEYLAAIEEAEYYDIDVELSSSDRLLTLQTCIEDHDELREIVVCKQIAQEVIMD